MLLILSTLSLFSLIVLDWPDEQTHIIFCDVGQGDSVLIYQGFNQILIDAGANLKARECLNKHLPFWDKKLELVVATHADKDHIGGFESVFKEFYIEKMILTEFGKETGVFSTFREAVLREKEIGLELLDPYLFPDIILAEDLKFITLSTWGREADFSIFTPEKTETELWDIIETQAQFLKESKQTHNSLSVVNLLEVGKVKILLTGDLGLKGEQALLEAGLITEVDILKIGHHGSKTSTGPEFLEAASPEIAVISVGKKNSYNHPSLEILQNLRNSGSQVWRTDETGDVEIVTDGERYWVE